MRGRKAKAIRRFMERQRHLTSEEATNLYRKLKKNRGRDLKFAVIDKRMQVIYPEKIYFTRKGTNTHVIF